MSSDFTELFETNDYFELAKYIMTRLKNGDESFTNDLFYTNACL